MYRVKYHSKIMGFWKDVAYDMSFGMSKSTAIKVNANLRNAKTEEEHKEAYDNYCKEVTIAVVNQKLNIML